MRPWRLGRAALAAALISAALFGAAATASAAAKPADQTPPITKEARDAGMKAAPALITAANLPCQLADARFIGTAPDPTTKKDTKYYEVACTGSVGYVLVDHGVAGTPPSWAACPDQPKVGADGKPNGAACFLPGNQDWKAQVAPLVARAKTPCDVNQVRGIGHTPDAEYFEVACANGRGYILKTSAPPRLDQPVALINCLAFDPTTQLGCKLSNPAAQLAVVDALAGQSGKGCQVKDRRYILTSPEMDNYYEVACQNGKGYVLEEGPDGKLLDTIDCAIADPIGGGCTLTNARQAQTEQLDLYSKLAHKAGFACDVSKYAPFPVAPNGYEVVELACSNRPDGAVGIFPGDSTKPARILDCAHSELEAYRCSFSKAADAFPHLTDDLRKLGKTSCAVSGERIAGVTEDKTIGLIEVACADGAPGYVISYNMADMSPKDATACTFAKGTAGGCELPQNNKHS